MTNMGEKQDKIWLAVAGIVVNSAGEWLVVKKKYGGLKGQWSLPAGFVKSGETLDEAVIREVKEETGINAEVLGVVGVRTGVIHNEISDNMIIFWLRALSEKIIVQTDELFKAAFLSKEMLKESRDSSALLTHLAQLELSLKLSPNHSINPGNHFGYSRYHLYF
jgi:8-oxo-dGTP diphosphatase